MRRYSRVLARWDLRLVGSLTLAGAWLVVLASFVYDAASATPPPETIVAAVVLLGIAITGILYAWREPGA